MSLLSVELKERLWSMAAAGICHVPERLRLICLESPLTVPLGIENLRIIAHSRDEYYERAQSAAKEPFTVNWLRAMSASGLFIDIGANVGAYSLMAARLCGGLQVLAIEPSGPTYASLCENISINGLGDQIEPIPMALNRYTGMGTFAYSSCRPGAALHNQTPSNGQRIMHWRLDDLLIWGRWPTPTHIKIDVDGGEVNVLTGMPRALRSASSIMIEIDDTNLDEARTLLTLAGKQMMNSWRVGSTTRNYLYE